MTTAPAIDLFAWKPPKARRTDPETSAIAATRAAKRASTGRLLVLRTLRTKGSLTDFELATATGWQQTSIGVRRGECVKAGYVAPIPLHSGGFDTRPSPTGSPARVWEITEAGRAYLREQQQ